MRSVYQTSVILAALLLASAGPAKADVGRSPASEFGVGAVACSMALGPKKIDFKALEDIGWVKVESRGSIDIYSHKDVSVKLFLSKIFAGSGQCVVDGYAIDDDQFEAIKISITDALIAKYGDRVKLPDPVSPMGQGFVIDDLMQILSSEKRANGLSIRVTSMRFPK
tara:strand:- start:3025 stop:3525 length:501 start_codon:yes stop_codon:yes gene_type:complete